MYRRNLENKINKLQLLKKRRNLDKLGDKAYSITRWQRCHLLRRCSTSGPRCTSTSPRKAFADSYLEDGELQKLLASPLYARRASGKTDAMVVQEIHRIWEDLFLKAIKIICSIRQDQTWRSKNFMSSPSTNALVNYNDKGKSTDWRYRTHNTYLLSLDEKKFDYKKTCQWKKKFSETLTILNNSSLPNCSKCKNRWILWTVLENSRKGTKKK